MAGFLPGFGRGGITHSLLVTEVLGGSTAVLVIWTPVPTGLIAICGVEDGVDTFDEGEKSEAGEEAVVGEMASLVGHGLVAMLEDKFRRTEEDAMLTLQRR